VPTAEWDSLAPKISKCTHCADRCDQPVPSMRNGVALTSDEGKRYQASIQTPACVKACPADALNYGTREDMLKEANRRIAARPDKYVNHIYGEKEAGGTSVLYLSSVPFEKLGFPTLPDEPIPAKSAVALGAVPPAVMVIGALLGTTYAFFKRRTSAAAHDLHPKFETLNRTLMTPFNWAMLALVALGGLSILARFVRGLERQHEPVEHVPVGLVDRLRSGLDRARRRRLRDGGDHLRPAA
jgi:formate dehydrogenase iron-sulfur subunit